MPIYSTHPAEPAPCALYPTPTHLGPVAWCGLGGSPPGPTWAASFSWCGQARDADHHVCSLEPLY